MKRNYSVGDIFRPQVTVLAMKDNIPSIVLIGGNKYVLQDEKSEEKEE